MIDSLKRNVFLAVILGCAAAVLGQPNQGIVRIDLKDRSSARNGLPETLLVYVEIATVQPDVEQGIMFKLNIENNSAQTIRIIDPIDTFGILLFGLTSPKIMSLPDTKPDSSICDIRSFSQKNLKAFHDNKMARRSFLAFDVDEARRNLHLKSVSDIVPWELPKNLRIRSPRRTTPLSKKEVFEGSVGGKLTLEPGQHFQAVIQINRVIADYKAHKKAYDLWLSDYGIPNDQGFCNPAEGAPPQPKAEIIPIPPGKYHLSVSMILFTDNLGFFTPSFDKWITIQLGEPDISKPKDAVIP